MDFSFSFPAIRGTQAGKDFYSIMCPLEVLSKLFDFYNNEIPEESRAQRTLNEKRIPEIKDYILDNMDSYIFSSITASIDGAHTFTSSDFNKDIGVLQISMNSNLLINDGQHRKAALDEAIKEMPILKNETISVVLFVDHGLKQSQQMFSDLNRHAVNVSNSLSILYNHRDPYSQVTRQFLDQNPKVSNLVEKNNSSIGKLSRKLFTLSNFHSANLLLLHGINLESNPQVIDEASKYWKLLFCEFNEWSSIIENSISASSSRQVSIATYGIIIEALGQIGSEIIQNDGINKNSFIEKLNNIDWSRSNPLWLNRCIQQDGSIKKSTTNRKLTVIAIKREIALHINDSELFLEESHRKDIQNG